MMFDLLYSIHLDDEPYPYWVGVSGPYDPDPKTAPPRCVIVSEVTGTPFAQDHAELEHWCHAFVRRGFDFRTHHDAFNGTHQVFMFMDRVDAMRFSLLEIMTNRIVTY